MGKQKKISAKTGRYGWVGGVTEYESEGLPTSSGGPYELDEGFNTIYNFDVLNELVPDTQNKFKNKILKTISKSDFDKINLGLSAYVKSSTHKDKNLEILKASILNAYDRILFDLYTQCDEGVKQLYGMDYFEDVNNLIHNCSSNIINPKSICKYREIATEFTVKCLSDFLVKTESDLNIEDYQVHRGLGNYQYYKKNALDNIADTISKFKGIGMEHPIEYVERQVLSSYSLSERVAERFMVQKENQRRAKITTTFKVTSYSLFSSFIVSDIFNINQYELLCLPFTERNYIFEEVNDEFSAEFFINDSDKYPANRLRRSEIK